MYLLISVSVSPLADLKDLFGILNSICLVPAAGQLYARSGGTEIPQRNSRHVF